MLYFKYSKNVSFPSYAKCLYENRNGNNVFLSVHPYFFILIVSIQKMIGSFGILISSAPHR